MLISKLYQPICFCLLVLLLISSQINAAEPEDTVPLNQPIQLIERAAPEYPTLALAQGIEGWVKVVFTISDSGQIVDVVVAEGYPEGVFDAAAVNAVKKFIISPKIENGVAVAQRASQTIEFELPENHDQLVKELEEQFAGQINDGQIDASLFEVPDDIQWLVTGIESHSKIKLHERSLKSLKLKVKSDVNGLPVEVAVVKNELGRALEVDDLTELKAEVLFFALKAHHFFGGYFNPYFTMQFAKNKPAEVRSQIVAKSMPVPKLRLDVAFQARLTISAEGELIDISEPTVDGADVPLYVIQDMFKILDYSPAIKKNRAVEDVIDVKLTMTAVQKEHIQFLRANPTITMQKP